MAQRNAWKNRPTTGSGDFNRMKSDPRMTPDPETMMQNLSIGSEKTVPPSPSNDSGVYNLRSSLEGSRSSSCLSDVESVNTVVLPSRPGRGTEGRRIQLISNIFELKTDGDARPLLRYDVQITQQLARDKTRDMSKGACNEYFLTQKRELCYLVFKQVANEIKAQWGCDSICGLVFDRRNTLYTREILFDGLSKDYYVSISAPELCKGDERSEFKVTLSFTDQEEIDLNSLEQVTTLDMAEFDRSVQQCIEVITSQVLYDNPHYVAHGSKFFRRSGKAPVNLGHGRELAEGLVKSSKVIEGSNGAPAMAIVADVKQSAFFKPQMAGQTLLETLRSMNRRPCRELPSELTEDERFEFNRGMKELSLKNKMDGKDFMVDHVTHIGKDANNLMIQYKDAKRNNMIRKLSVSAYYEKIKNYKLKYPLLPLFAERIHKGEFRYHPIEFCEVLPNQSVNIQKQNPEQMSEMIKKSALKPSDQLNDLKQKIQETGLISNQHLMEMGLSVVKRPLAVEGRVLPKPAVAYENKKVDVRENGNWEQGYNRFHSSGKCGNWAALNLDPCQQGSDMMRFLNCFEKGARTIGIQMGKCVVTTDTSREELDYIFKQAKKADVDFILFFLPDKRMDKIVKDLIKYYERMYEIITQCVTKRVAAMASGNERKAQMTMSNILAKTNPKLGGLNYDVSSERTRKLFKHQETMIIGCDVSHPPPQPSSRRHLPPSEPSVVGFVSNDPTMPNLFTGEVAYQSPREEMVDSMQNLMKEMLQRWMEKSHGGRLPKRIFYFRDGVSEGQFAKVIMQEVEPMKQACQDYGNGEIPKFTVVICIKRHHERIYLPMMADGDKNRKKNDNATRQDVPAGTVVDTKMVHPTRWEFYIKAHQALQGTAKPLKVTVILDENGLNATEMEDIVNVLCHGHQITTKSVSLPAPVYGAHEMGERGKRLWRAYSEIKGIGSTDSGDSGCSGIEGIDWDEVTKQLSYSGSKLANRKFWA